MKKLIAALVVLVVFATPALAHQDTVTKQGKNFDSRSCSVGGGCTYTIYSDGDMKVHTESATAKVVYKIPVTPDHPYVSATWIHANSEACASARASARVLVSSSSWTWVEVEIKFNIFSGVGNCRIVKAGAIFSH